MSADRFLNHCLRFDLETNESGEIYAIGARWSGGELQFSGRFELADALTRLDQAAADCDLLVGHNLLHHDLEVLRSVAPHLALLEMPVVDTLYLSPLAFPENPYHRLVKDYQRVRDARNEPLSDVRLSETLLRDQWRSFAELALDEPALIGFYRACLQRPEHAGLARFFEAIGGAGTAVEPGPWLGGALRDQVCRSALGEQIATLTESQRPPIHWAYALAWLRVAGGNSVLPPWVRHRFPACTELLHALRETPCDDAACDYCQRQHDPVKQLQRWFGFTAFRPQPANPDGSSLQQAIVSRAMAGRPLFAILPTGGGKSLCFQIPALARHLRLGLLTIVISPLQALMKDQVDNLCERTGGNLAGALYGLLSAPERAALLRAIRMGDLALLYVSPEQLRNPGFQAAIAHREIGAWVFDEAHCLSKWGHDFRPDYLYAARFIKEFAAQQQGAPPPVQCFTATAKRSVIDEVRDHFKRELGQQLTLFRGGVERDNLQFEVQPINAAQKLARLQQILSERLPEDGGSAVVYCASRRGSEEAAAYLAAQDLAAAHFHAGMDAGHKREVQEAFIAGRVRIICATNAFGMGIDKDDVRLVIHLEIPGSLENYLQEAGRAGRDRADAACILLYDPKDIEQQFSLGAHSRLSQRDIIEILRSLRRMQRNERDEVVLTSAELLRDDQLDVGFDASDRQADTKVRSAIAWLERARLIERNQNRTQVFQGRPLVRDLQQAQQRIRELGLSRRQQRRWLSIIESLLQADADQGFSADELAESGGFARADGDRRRESDSQRVLRTLHDMAAAGLIQKSTQLSALLRHQVKDPSTQRLERVCRLEQGLLALLREQAPDAADGSWQQLSLRRLNQHLLDADLQSSPEALRGLLYGLAQDGQGLAAQRGSLSLRQSGRDELRLRLHRNWRALDDTAALRRAVAGAVLKVLQGKLRDDAPASAQLLVEFALEDLLQGLRRDALLAAQVKDPLAAAERGLLFLHEQKVIHLQKGLAVFRQAMTLRIRPEATRRRYTKGDFAPLAYHYGERVFQVHVIDEYARLGLDRISDALALVLAYFSDSKQDFIRHFFPGRKEQLERALSEQAYKRITDGLSPVQAAVVSASVERNLLVLAGPGAGKTRLVVHRCAWLLQVQRVPARGILVLGFNRSTALELRRRLSALVGDDARGVTIQTYHGLALRLSGHSLAAAAEDGSEAPSLDSCLQQAIDLLTGTASTPGSDKDALREQLLQGYRHILVDEYQDIDDLQYQLVSAIAGRSLGDPEARLDLLAVGDDDQNVYSFRGANVAFIRRFQDDYQAQQHHLVENFRSSAHIIACANRLIELNRERMKDGHPIRIDERRKNDPSGGLWQARDPVAGGRVQCLSVATADHQAAAVVAELDRLRQLAADARGDGATGADLGADLGADVGWSDCAVLARGWAQLTPLRALCESRGIPTVLMADEARLPSRWRIREYALLLGDLRGDRDRLLDPAQLDQRVAQLAGDHRGNPWWREIDQRLDESRIDCGDSAQPAGRIGDFLYEALAEDKRLGRPGDGLLLSTAHSVKGREFNHVFVLDGAWTTQAIEQERRLYYVAMTRARQTLCLLETDGGRNPHCAELKRGVSGDSLLQRRWQPSTPLDRAALARRFELLGPQDLFLDFAAGYPAAHPIHQQLATLQPGRLLRLAADGRSLQLLGADDLPLARISKGDATARWSTRLDAIVEVRVVAMMQRRSDDVKDPRYRQRLRVDRWELPIVEIAWQTDALIGAA